MSQQISQCLFRARVGTMCKVEPVYARAYMWFWHHLHDPAQGNDVRQVDLEDESGIDLVHPALPEPVPLGRTSTVNLGEDVAVGCWNQEKWSEHTRTQLEIVLDRYRTEAKALGMDPTLIT
jgi:hypothetical protein